MATTNYDDTGRDAFFAICQPRIDHLEPDTPFTLPELLDDRWALFTRNTRPQTLGAVFAAGVNTGDLKRTAFVGIQSSPRMSLWQRTE